jgi:hypothetical protein
MWLPLNLISFHQHFPQFPEPPPHAGHRQPGVPGDLLERQAVHEMEDGHRPCRFRVPPEQPVEQQPRVTARARLVRRGNRCEQRFVGGSTAWSGPAGPAVPGRGRKRPGTRRGPRPRFEAASGTGGAPSGRTVGRVPRPPSPHDSHCWCNPVRGPKCHSGVRERGWFSRPTARQQRPRPRQSHEIQEFPSISRRIVRSERRPVIR